MAEEQKNKSEHKVHVSEYKKKVVKDLVKNMKEYPIIGAINMENMPAAPLQDMREKLRGQAHIVMAKRRVMKHAFDEAKKDVKNIEKLIPQLKGMPALLFTKENPFKLFKFIKKNKSSAPAKAGQEAPKDIEIKAGPTPFAPGPVIGELNSLGLQTEVKEGKISIKEDAVVVKEGEKIDAKTAGLITRMGIEPMEVGLDLVAVYEDGVIYDKKVLDVDEDKFMKDLQNAARWAFNLAVEAGVFTEETVNVLVPKAFREAKSVALEGEIINDITKEEILSKAESQAQSLKAEAKIEDAPAKKEEKNGEKEASKKEEPKKEEKEEKEDKTEKSKEKVKEEPKKEESEKEEKIEKSKKEEKSAEKKKTEERSKSKETEQKKAKPEGKEKDKTKKKDKSKKENKSNKKEDAEKENEASKDKEKIQVVDSESPEEKIEKEEKEVSEDIKNIKKEIKKEEKDPKAEDIEKIEKEVEDVEEKLEKVDKEKKELPPKEKIIINKEKKTKSKERKIDPKKKKMAEQGEKLFEQLKKKGTLRDIEKGKKNEEQPKKPKSPEDIIAQAHKNKKDDSKSGDVPSAYDLKNKKDKK